MSSTIREACSGCVNLCLTTCKDTIKSTNVATQQAAAIVQYSLIPLAAGLKHRAEGYPTVHQVMECTEVTLKMTQVQLQALQYPMAIAIQAIDRVQPAPQIMA